MEDLDPLGISQMRRIQRVGWTNLFHEALSVRRGGRIDRCELTVLRTEVGRCNFGELPDLVCCVGVRHLRELASEYARFGLRMQLCRLNSRVRWPRFWRHITLFPEFRSFNQGIEF